MSVTHTSLQAQDTINLNLTTSATGVTNRTLDFEWSVSKSSDPTALQLDPDETEDIMFTLAATRTEGPISDTYTVSGEVCVTNNGALTTEGLSITDTLIVDGTPGLIVDVDLGLQTSIAPGITTCYPYQHEFQLADALSSTITNQATATISNGDQLSYISTPVAVDLSPINLTPLDESITLTDTVVCPDGFTCTPLSLGPLQLFGTTTLPFTTSVTNMNADCNLSHTLMNTVSAIEANSALNRQANAAVVLSCQTAPVNGSITAIKYLDANSNGQQESGELLLSGWTIEVFDPVTGDLIVGDITDSAGSVVFNNLTPGTYTICETLTDSWINPSGNLCVDVLVSVEVLAQVTFGNRQPVTPLAECAIIEADGTLTAFFGYENPNPVAITLPVGDQNQFAPAPADRGQPTAFEPGRSAPWPNTAVTVAGLTSELSWSLDGSIIQSANTPCATRITLEKVWLNADATETEPPFDLGLEELVITAESDLGSATCGYQAETWVCTYINDPSAPDNDGLWVAAGDTYSVAESAAPDLWQSVEDTIGAGFDPPFTCLDSTAQCVHIVQNAQTIPSSPPGTSFTPR